MRNFFSRFIRRKKQADVQVDELYVLVIRQANYMLANDATLKETAEYFDCAASTIHRHMHNVLAKIHPRQYDQIQRLLERHARESIQKPQLHPQ